MNEILAKMIESTLDKIDALQKENVQLRVEIASLKTELELAHRKGE
jgi:hypothetical protein